MIILCLLVLCVCVCVCVCVCHRVLHLITLSRLSHRRSSAYSNYRRSCREQLLPVKRCAHIHTHTTHTPTQASPLSVCSVRSIETHTHTSCASFVSLLSTTTAFLAEIHTRGKQVMGTDMRVCVCVVCMCVCDTLLRPPLLLSVSSQR